MAGRYERYRRTVSIASSKFDGLAFPEGDPTDLRLTLAVGEPGAWVLGNRTLDPAGRVATRLPAWFAECLPGPPSGGGGGVTRAEGTATIASCLTRLSDAGYRQQLVYLPASRFWPLQWAETGLFLALPLKIADGTGSPVRVVLLTE